MDHNETDTRQGRDLAILLRERGLRATGPRLLILSRLQELRDHPTPEQIHDALRDVHPTLSLSTVYGTLEAFLEAGLCRRVATTDARLRVDGTIHEHDHAVCRLCGAILDLDRTEEWAPPVPPHLPPGMRLVGARVEYDVICPACAAGEAEESSSN
ncbi:MAG: transcriptional repressor [Candidatus Eisenbacteria bacterium]|nr:transcriptional repressor [Candidatus Eisenbacteria bacterium]